MIDMDIQIGLPQDRSENTGGDRKSGTEQKLAWLRQWEKSAMVISHREQGNEAADSVNQPLIGNSVTATGNALTQLAPANLPVEQLAAHFPAIAGAQTNISPHALELRYQPVENQARNVYVTESYAENRAHGVLRTGLLQSGIAQRTLFKGAAFRKVNLQFTFDGGGATLWVRTREAGVLVEVDENIVSLRKLLEENGIRLVRVMVNGHLAHEF
jgi:hypothetical protein